MIPYYEFLNIRLYDWGYIAALLVVALISIWYRKKYNVSGLQVFFMTVILVPLIFFAIKISKVIDGYGGFNWVRMVTFLPLLVYLASIAINMPFVKTSDFFAPHVGLYNAVAHSFCIFAGCCYGYPCSFGVWNEIQHDYLFPVQLCESTTSFLIFLYMIWYAKKKNYKTHGISYAQFLFLFGLTRTFWEFFRDNTKVLFGKISVFQFYSFAAFVLGIIWIIITLYLQKHPEFVKKHELFFREDVGELTRIKMFLRKRKQNR